MKKAFIIGRFNEDNNRIGGQTVKTRLVSEELKRIFGKDEICIFDTNNGRKSLVKIPFIIFKALKNSANVIIFPAHNGLRLIAPLLRIENSFFHRKLHYCVIGGWLPGFIKNRKILSKSLKAFDGIYVETTTMRKALNDQGFSNVVVMPNCKNLRILDESALNNDYVEPYKLCTFSRVSKEKGIDDAVIAIKKVNEKLGRNAFSLDIYGPIHPEQISWFDSLRKQFPEYISYGGTIPFDRSVDLIKDYFLLLFPTKSPTEGIPGTILDAYAAGVPVLSSVWESFADLIEDGKTGFGYELGNNEMLISKLCEIAAKPEIICPMKKQCIKRAYDYLPQISVTILSSRMK